jgi:hypothetical protein
MRQKDDATFAHALNRLAIGQMTEEDVKLFQSREVSKIGYPKGNCLRIYKDNKSVTAYNEKVLSGIAEESVVAKAIDTIQGKCKAATKAAKFEFVSNLPIISTMGLPYRTHLVVSARYMCTLNVDTPEGLVNGSLGTLKKITYGKVSDGKRIPTAAWIDFGDPKVGISRRKAYSNLAKCENISSSWTPMSLEKRSVHSWPGEGCQVCKQSGYHCGNIVSWLTNFHSFASAYVLSSRWFLQKQ